MDYNKICSTKDIKKSLKPLSSTDCKAGPVLLWEDGEQYVDDSECPVCVIGRTGAGKTQCSTLPFNMSIVEKGESGIIADANGNVYRSMARYIPADYQLLVLDFSDPDHSMCGHNLLAYPYKLYKSGNKKDRDAARLLINDLVCSIYPIDENDEIIWTLSARKLCKAMIYAMFDYAPPEDINLASVAYAMEKLEVVTSIPAEPTVGEKKDKLLYYREEMEKRRISNMLYSTLEKDSPAKSALSEYVYAANDTRRSIYFSACDGIEQFTMSSGVEELLSGVNETIFPDVTKPFLIYIINPFETDIFDSFAGIIINQLFYYLIREARNMGGKLPVRVNVILEEMGSIGKSIIQFPRIISESRAFNIRIMFVVQSLSQLGTIYGQNGADTIFSCVGITICFPTNDWKTLCEWSQRCGERCVIKNGVMIKKSIISPQEIEALDKGKALVFATGGTKYIASFCFFYKMKKKPENVIRYHKRIKPDPEFNRWEFETFVMYEYSRHTSSVYNW